MAECCCWSRKHNKDFTRYLCKIYNLRKFSAYPASTSLLPPSYTTVYNTKNCLILPSDIIEL